MNVTPINEKISVGVVFSKENPSPKWFKWRNKKYPVDKITFSWKSFSGSSLLIHFSLSSSNNYYEISFNTKELSWILDKIGTT